jgi:hypothetical protein
MTVVSGNARVMVVGALLLVACGGGVSQEDYAESYSAALCHRQARCGEIRDEDACVRNAREFTRGQREQGLAPYFQFEKSMAAGRLRFDEEAAEDCVQGLRDSACDQSLDVARNGDICDVLEGRQKDGEPCVLTEECGEASYCDGLTEAACMAGTCKPRPGLGQPVTDAQECASGLVPVNGTCQARAEEGGSCTTNSRCAPGLYCESGGMCRRFAVEGGACGDSGPQCLAHLTCKDGSCQRLFDVDADCTPSPGGPGPFSGDCKRDLVCEGGGSEGPGTCRERAGLGESCINSTCQTNLSCDWGLGATMTCQPFRQPGESCATLPCGPGAICNDDTMVCERLGRLGDPCPSDREPWLSCISGLTCQNGRCEAVFGGFCGKLK